MGKNETTENLARSTKDGKIAASELSWAISPKGYPVQMVKIRIADRKASAKAMVEMARRGRIDCYPDDVYIVPEPALELLRNLGVTYDELGRGGYDYAQKALRDALAAQTQRRENAAATVRAV